MFIQLFGKYLVEKKAITDDILRQIIEKQKTVRVKLGTIAVSEGILTEAQVEEINEMQKQQDKRFGDIAVDMELLSPDQIVDLLSKQGNAYMQFIELTTSLSRLTNSDIEEFLKIYKKDMGFSDEELEALKADDIDKLMPLFVFSSKPYIKDIAGLVIRNLVRFVSSDFYIEKASHVKELSYAELSTQEMNGDHNIFIGIAEEEDKGGFLKIGNSFSHCDKAATDADTFDAVSEFINVTSGLFVTEKSKAGVNIDMEPPLSFKAQKAVGDFYVIPVYLEGKKVDIVLAVDSEFTAGETPENTGAVTAQADDVAAGGENTALIVDDSRMSRMMMRGILEKAGLKVVAEAANGAEGLEAFKKYKPVVVTLDITMPVMDGLEALEEILKVDAEAKVIMVTAAGQQDKLIKALKIGAKRFINKPFNEEEIVRNIKEVM